MCALMGEETLTRNLNNTCQKYSLSHVRLIRRRNGHCSWKLVLSDELDSLSNQQQKISPANRHHSIKSPDCVFVVVGSEGDPSYNGADNTPEIGVEISIHTNGTS